MEINDINASSDFAAETRRVNRRQLIQQSISLAMQSRWQEAAEINRQIVEMTPDDSESFNRLGKAYTELGRIADARDAYESALRADPANGIAQRQLARLSLISEMEAAELASKAPQKLDPRFFMEETGKTRVAALRHTAGSEVLATLTAGDQAQLDEHDGHIVVTAPDGTRIGTLDRDLSVRLMRLMGSGNQYQAGVVGVDGTEVRIMIRETVQSAQNAGRISFPPRSAAEALPRPYLREGLMRRGATSEDEDEDELDPDARDSDGDEEDEDSSEFGFHEGNLDES